ncbi:CU044_5270 family protein [Kitasatospora terrestris]|uniref:CU044_5270 family protein n=1 Tax=Kitasatospora terrestris TaxID=258051 RepID=A0ABP9DNB0_9ACTN
MNDEREVLAADRHQLLRGHLMSEINRERIAAAAARPKRRLGWLALPALAGGLAVAVALSSGGAQPAPPAQAQAPASAGAERPPAGKGSSAVLVLDHIAAVAAAKPAKDVKPNQFVHVKSTVAFAGLHISDSGNRYVPGTPHQRQIWLSVDGSRPGLLVEEGQTPPTRTKPGDTWAPNPDGSIPLQPNDHPSVNSPTYQFLAGLPTDPDALLKEIYEGVANGKQNGDRGAFATIGNLLREQIAPPGVTAGLYRAAGKIPGVEVSDDAVDASGRHGFGVAHVDGGVRYEWIFDRSSYEFLGERDVVVSEGTEWGAPGTVIGHSAVVERTVVDKAGDGR